MRKIGERKMITKHLNLKVRSAQLRQTSQITKHGYLESKNFQVIKVQKDFVY